MKSFFVVFASLMLAGLACPLNAVEKATIAEDGYWKNTVETSAAEMIQLWQPGASVLKAFGTVGSNNVDERSADGLHTVPIAADDPSAKETVGRIAAELGFDSEGAFEWPRPADMDNLAEMPVVVDMSPPCDKSQSNN